MIFTHRDARLQQQFAQSFRGDSVVSFPADRQVGALIALVLAKPSSQPHRRSQPAALEMRIDHGQVLRVSARKAGASEANNNLDNTVIRGHCSPP
jgi:hypothetical protein